MMIILRTETIPEHLRGYLERFLYQVRAGLFIGTVNRRVAGELWETVMEYRQDGDAVMITPANNEQGFVIVTTPHPRISLTDFDGITLVSVTPHPADEKPLYGDFDPVIWNGESSTPPIQ